MSDPLLQFIREYVALCRTHGMAISTTQDGGLTVARGNTNIPSDHAVVLQDEWPRWDGVVGEYVSARTAAARDAHRRQMATERVERAEYARLHAKYGAKALPDTAAGSALGNASPLPQ